MSDPRLTPGTRAHGEHVERMFFANNQVRRGGGAWLLYFIFGVIPLLIGVAPFVLDDDGGAAPKSASVYVGGLIFIAFGLGVLMIPVLRSRSRRKRDLALQAHQLAQTGDAQAPPGWHRDPYQRRAWRWWSGNEWTQTVADQDGRTYTE